MRKLSNLVIVVALIMASTGTTAASAVKPVADPPTIDIGVPSAECQWNGSAFDLVVTLKLGDITITNGVLSSFSMDVARVDETTPPPYGQRTGESWYYGWREGSGDPAPVLPYDLNTGERGDAWPVSWTSHHVSELEGIEAAQTGYWEVGLWAEAVGTQGKGRNYNQDRAWDGKNWYLVCDEADASHGQLFERPQFTWCSED